MRECLISKANCMYEDNDAAVSGERTRQRVETGAKVLKVVLKVGMKVGTRVMGSCSTHRSNRLV
jgi:hypothetical protein